MEPHFRCHRPIVSDQGCTLRGQLVEPQTSPDQPRLCGVQLLNVLILGILVCLDVFLLDEAGSLCCLQVPPSTLGE